MIIEDSFRDVTGPLSLRSARSLYVLRGNCQRLLHLHFGPIACRIPTTASREILNGRFANLEAINLLFAQFLTRRLYSGNSLIVLIVGEGSTVRDRRLENLFTA